jgi:hypothetical protein
LPNANDSKQAKKTLSDWERGFNFRLGVRGKINLVMRGCVLQFVLLTVDSSILDRKVMSTTLIEQKVYKLLHVSFVECLSGHHFLPLVRKSFEAVIFVMELNTVLICVVIFLLIL